MEKEFNMFDESTVGSLKISEDVIATISRIAAMEIDGVVEVAHSSSGVKGFISKSAIIKAVKVEMTGEAVGVELNLIVEAGSRIPDIAAAVQKNVKSAIETITGLSVMKVDINIAGVGSKPAEEETADD